METDLNVKLVGQMVELSQFVNFKGPGRPTAWPEQSQVVVETITKTSTTQKFSAMQQQQLHQSDASQVTAVGPGLQRAIANKETTFTVDVSRAGKCLLVANCNHKLV